MRVVDIDMRFQSMVVFMVQTAIAAIPAMLILTGPAVVVAFILGAVFSAGRGASFSKIDSAFHGGSAPVSSVYTQVLQSDLRTLAMAEKAFFSTHHAFTTDLHLLHYAESGSPGVAITGQVKSDGSWWARAWSTQSCTITGDQFNLNPEPHCAAR